MSPEPKREEEDYIIKPLDFFCEPRPYRYDSDDTKKPVKRYLSQKVVAENDWSLWLRCEVEFQDGTFGTITECR